MTWAETEPCHLVALADVLGPDQPLCGIPPPAGANLPTCVDDWVDHFAARLAELPVEAPYFLGGWSFGGVVALELARRLRRAGTPVAFVGMVDSWRPKRNPKGVTNYLEYHLGEMLGLPRGARFEYALGRVRKGAQQRSMRCKRMVWRSEARLGLRVPLPAMAAGIGAERRAIFISYLKYEPTAYDAPVSIYSCPDSIAECSGDSSLGWARWLQGGFEQVTLASSHFTVFDPEGVGDLAGALRRSLRLARERAAPVPPDPFAARL